MTVDRLVKDHNMFWRIVQKTGFVGCAAYLLGNAIFQGKLGPPSQHAAKGRAQYGRAD